MSLRLIHPGLATLLVDAGRPHWRSLGVPVGGAADRTALAIANALIGNAPETLALEFAFAGPTLQAEQRTAAAVFGAPFALSINDRSILPGSTFQLQPGDVLRIGGTAHGARGYLSVTGGFQAPEVLGSRSSLEPLRSEQVLECAASSCEPRGLGFAMLPELLPEIRVLDGPQRDWFTDCFFTQPYRVLPAGNRMGLRLAGEALVRKRGELASEAVAPGAIQITNDGQPVVLGVDGQTIGGYPKIAHVIRADLDRLAQFRPGEIVQFRRVTWEEGEAAANEKSATTRSWLARIRAAERVPTLN